MPQFRYLVTALTAMALTFSTVEASTSAFDRLVVFGDSLSDTGNAGRFSNGPVWVEQLASRLGVALAPNRQGGLNFAVGGARLDPLSGPHSLRAQTDHFLRTPVAPTRTLYIVYGGGNDLLAAVGRSDGPAMVDRAVASLKSLLEDLLQQGATDILVPNLPDVGMTPAIQRQAPRAVAEAGRLTTRFNGALERVLTDVTEKPEVRFHRLDVWALGERARADPTAFGFADVVTPCERLPSCQGFLFWDDVHPTAQAHSRLTEAAFRAVLP